MIIAIYCQFFKYFRLRWVSLVLHFDCVSTYVTFGMKAYFIELLHIWTCSLVVRDFINLTRLLFDDMTFLQNLSSKHTNHNYKTFVAFYLLTQCPSKKFLVKFDDF